MNASGDESQKIDQMWFSVSDDIFLMKFPEKREVVWANFLEKAEKLGQFFVISVKFLFEFRSFLAFFSVFCCFFCHFLPFFLKFLMYIFGAFGVLGFFLCF
jgi:hypothetical protein